MTLLKDIVARPRPALSNEALNAAYKWFADNRANFKSSCNFAQFNAKGEMKSHLNQACHANIQYVYAFPNIECVATDIAIDRREDWYKSFVGSRSSGQDVTEQAKEWGDGMTWERVDAYLKWFLYESYFSPFILNKHDIDFVKNYGIIVTADIPAALLQNIMISSRYFIECSPESFDMFNHLTAKGVDPRIAYVVSFSTTISSYTMRLSKQDIKNTRVGNQSSHRSTPLLSLAGMKNMLNDDLSYSSVLDEKCNYRNYTNYSGGSMFFGSGNFIEELLQSNEDVRQALSEYRKTNAQGEAYAPPNPFASRSPKAAHSPLDFTFPEMFECLVTFIAANKILEK